MLQSPRSPIDRRTDLRSLSPPKHSHGYDSHSHQQGHHIETGYSGTFDKPEPLHSAYQKEEVVTKPGIVKQLTERFELV